MNEVSIESYVSVKALAEILNVSEATIKRAIEKLRSLLGGIETNSQGGYLLNEEQATIVKNEIAKHHNIGECAKVLNKNIGRNRLFEFLRNRNVLQSNNIPYQKYIDAGYFRVIASKYVAPKGETKISLKTVVFQKGVAYINKLLSKAVENA